MKIRLAHFRDQSLSFQMVFALAVIFSATLPVLVFAELILPPPPGWTACDKDPGSAECLEFCTTALGQAHPKCPDHPINDAECWVGLKDNNGDTLCPSIPIPMPVIGWYPGKLPVRVASDPEAYAGEGVWVWNTGGVEGKDKEGGVYVFNKEAEPLWTRCWHPEKQCTYFIELSENEKVRVGDILSNSDLYMQNMLNIFTEECPTYAKIAGVKIISDVK